jgi:hypothetical protein
MKKLFTLMVIALAVNRIVAQSFIPYATCLPQGICNYLASPNGAIVIFGNAPGCNSQQEVEAVCG